VKLLWVKTNLLHPLDSGGTIRTYNMLRCLREQHEITYVTLKSNGAEEYRRQASEYASTLIEVPWHGAPPRSNWRFYAQALANLRSDMPFALARYQVPALKDTLRTITDRSKVDVAVSDFLFPAPHFESLAGVPKLLFQHNVESLIWQRTWERSRGPMRPYWKRQAQRMEHWERCLTRQFDHVVTVSAEDADLMRTWIDSRRVTAIPTGVDTEYFRPKHLGVDGKNVLFVGSLDWIPNIDGVRWLVNHVWPLIQQRRPDARLHVVGRRPGREVKRLIARTAGARLWPDVLDVREHLWQASVVVVPLRIGGGTRLKIFEALGCQKAVVSTTVGAEGLPVLHGEHLLLADEATDFADSVLQLLEKPADRERLAMRGRQLVVEHHSWEQVAAKFTTLCQDVAAGNDRLYA